MENWTLHAAKTYVISELEAAEQRSYRRCAICGMPEKSGLKSGGTGDRGLNIADWCKAHMPVSCQWLTVTRSRPKAGGNS